VTDTAEIERRFHQRMLDGYRETGEASKAIGKPYWPSRYLQTVRRHGGRTAAKRWLARPDAQAGFDRMLDLDLVRLTIEAIVLDPRWSVLFTPKELETARRRLAKVGYSPPS
jgi:hypothetical protein